MLEAAQVRKIADDFNAICKKRAQEFAADELETFLMPRIQKAAQIGNYSISYFWKRSIFQEAQIMPDDFEDALVELVMKLGYNIEVLSTTQMGVIEELSVIIDWRKKE